MIYDEQKRKEDAPKTLLTQEFDRKRPTVIEIKSNKENIYAPITQGYVVIDAASAPDKCRLAIKYMEYHNH